MEISEGNQKEKLTPAILLERFLSLLTEHFVS